MKIFDKFRKRSLVINFRNKKFQLMQANTDIEESNFAIRKLTESREWDHILEIFYAYIINSQQTFHRLRGDKNKQKLDEAQIRVELLLEILGEIEEAGGRIDFMDGYRPPEPEKKDDIEPERHFNIPKFAKVVELKGEKNVGSSGKSS